MNMIGREEAIWRIKKLEESALNAGDEKDALCYVRAYNAIMSCRVYEPGKMLKKPSMGGQQTESSQDR